MILVYYHGDMDGICSAAIIVKRYGQDIKAVPVQYDKDTWNQDDVTEASMVWVVDFTFNDMEALAEVAGDKLIWIDHHKTAEDNHKAIWWSGIKGNRSLDYSGCELTWTYCFPGDCPPDSVKYIGDRDTWAFKHGALTRSFCAGINAAVKDPFCVEWNSLLSYSYTTEMKMIYIGQILLYFQESRIKHLFESGIDTEFHGHKARMVNTTSDISELGEYIYSHDYEIAVMWQVKGEKVIVSLRSKTVDCAEIAQGYGGGGHKGAAGFSVVNFVGFPTELL